jgi:predicted AAA+ superfamily ATPase
MGLSKYAGQLVRQRASSPKLQVFNTALITAQSQFSLNEAKQQHDFWGRLVESAVGASLINSIRGENVDLFYWASRNREVDFILRRGETLVAFEVKSGRRRASLPGMEAFSKEFPVQKKILVGAQGISIEEFLLTPPVQWFS